ncbi:MAG: putative selenium-dependent hydroxylase accessory protein YqeC [Dorea sp.]|nr:putative selenium-dependent hydroxylase accessory protein YqeC [Dorea sp.]MDY2813942.1 selenium cofactor biosynthesis protein YqeC [Dorea sp.]
MERFPFLKEKGHVISIVGAGGKTTLMYALASLYAGNGVRTMVTTSTHILSPGPDLWAANTSEMQRLWSLGSYAVVGSPAEEGKLTALPESEFNSYLQMADIVLIEADGAKRNPCKVPASHEPVIVAASDIVIGVMGMDAWSRPIEEVCFRTEEAVRLLHTDRKELLTTEMMAEILASEDGTRKNVGERDYYVVLNQCDTQELQKAAEEICRKLYVRGIQKSTCISLEKEGFR